MNNQAPIAATVHAVPRATVAALEEHYRFVLWLTSTEERFPRSHSFLLGDRIQSTALDVLEWLIEAIHTPRRSEHLAAANLGRKKLRFLFRLARDLRLLDARRYEYAARNIDDPAREPDPPHSFRCGPASGETSGRPAWMPREN